MIDQRRIEDLPLLAQHFLQKYQEENQRGTLELEPAALDQLMGYDWPGNVRELENVIQRAMLFCGGDTIEASHIVFDRPISFTFRETSPVTPLFAVAPAAPALPAEPATLGNVVQMSEFQAIREMLAACGGSAAAATRLVTITVTPLSASM